MIIEKLGIGDLGFSENQNCPLCGESLNVVCPAEGPINSFECKKHGEYVLKIVLLPKGVLQFLEDMKSCLNGSVDDYLTWDIIESLRAHIDGDYFSPKQKEVSEKYGIAFDC